MPEARVLKPVNVIQTPVHPLVQRLHDRLPGVHPSCAATSAAVPSVWRRHANRKERRVLLTLSAGHPDSRTFEEPVMNQDHVWPAEMSLDQAVERQIVRRTWGQIHHLQVA